MRDVIKHGEYVCIYPLDILLKEGSYFIFVAIDVASEFAFEPLIEKDDKIQNLLRYIEQLIKDKNFSLRNNRPFTLVLSRYESDLPIIEKLIKPVGGTVIIDEDLVLETMTPFIEEFYGHEESDEALYNAIDLPDEDFSNRQLSFIEFLRLLPKQRNNELDKFQNFATADKSFLFSSDPKLLSEYLYLKLDLNQTLTFQKMFLIYASAVNKNTIPTKYLNNPDEMLLGVNHIVTLQEDDPKYPFSR